MMLVIIITTGFCVAFSVLQPGDVSRAAAWSDGPFLRPFWGLVGDFERDKVEEYFSDAANPERVVAPVMLFMYMIISSIILVNLLIAQMSSKFEKIMNDANVLWLQELVQMILEFKDDRDPVPPPFNVLYMFFIELPYKCYKYASGAKAPSSPSNGFKLQINRRVYNRLHQISAACRNTYWKMKQMSESSELQPQIHSIHGVLQEELAGQEAIAMQLDLIRGELQSRKKQHAGPRER